MVVLLAVAAGPEFDDRGGERVLARLLSLTWRLWTDGERDLDLDLLLSLSRKC